MSETFLEAWRTRENVEPDGGSLRPWLLGIATKKARNANRRVRVRAVNDGNETVPTVVAAGRPHANPDPDWVREQLSPSE